MSDNDFPTVMANGGQYLSGYVQRKGLYQQSGTDIPEGSMRYVVEQQLGGPLKGEVQLSGSPSFAIPGGKSKYRFPTLPSEDPEDVPVRFTYPVTGPKLPLV